MKPNIVAISGYEQAATAADSIVGELGGPLGIVARFGGFGSDEIDEGVPGWAWFVMGTCAGAVTTYVLRTRIEKVLS